MAAIATLQEQVRRARSFFGFLREAECPGDQIRLRGLGVIWPVDSGQLQQGDAARRDFERLQAGGHRS